MTAVCDSDSDLSLLVILMAMAAPSHTARVQSTNCTRRPSWGAGGRSAPLPCSVRT